MYDLQAYQDAMKKASGPLPSLPALTKYTNDQMFFMAFGQVNRLDSNPPYLLLQLLMSVYTVSKTNII